MKAKTKTSTKNAALI